MWRDVTIHEREVVSHTIHPFIRYFRRITCCDVPSSSEHIWCTCISPPSLPVPLIDPHTGNDTIHHRCRSLSFDRSTPVDISNKFSSLAPRCRCTPKHPHTSPSPLRSVHSFPPSSSHSVAAQEFRRLSFFNSLITTSARIEKQVPRALRTVAGLQMSLREGFQSTSSVQEKLAHLRKCLIKLLRNCLFLFPLLVCLISLSLYMSNFITVWSYRFIF